MRQLPRSVPEAEGVSSESLLKFWKAIDQLDHPHSLMLMRHGHVIAESWWEPYSPHTAHQLFSLSKSFTSAAVGIAIGEGKLKLDDKLVDLFPEARGYHVSERMARATLRHLLTMTSGHKMCIMGSFRNSTNWVKTYLESELELEPGTRFVYDSSATYMLSAAVSRATGMAVNDYLYPRLYEPLGIEAPRWESCPSGVSLGGWGLYLKTEDIAKFSVLLLQRGLWEGRQLIPADYLKLATSKQSDNSMNDAPDWKVGYGFQFWQCRHHAFRGDGACGQYAVVLPAQGLTIAMNSGMGDMQRALDIVWNVLLPELKTAEPLPPNPAAVEALRTFTAHTALPTATGDLARRLDNRQYVMADNPLGLKSTKLEFGADRCVLTLDFADRQLVVPAGFGVRLPSTLSMPGADPLNRPNLPRQAASSAAWTNLHELLIESWFIETPTLHQFRLRFDGDRLTFSKGCVIPFLEEPWAAVEGKSGAQQGA